jgi:hypothetical protein
LPPAIAQDRLYVVGVDLTPRRQDYDDKDAALFALGAAK